MHERPVASTLRARRLDRWLGVPLCFLATLLCALRRRLSPGEPRGPVRRILFILVTETGGLVAAHPALEEARRRFPGAEIAVLTSDTGLAVLPHLGLAGGGAHHGLRTGSAGAFVLDALRAVPRLRRRRFDATVNLETFTRFGALLAFATGARRRAGFDRFHDEGRFAGSLLTHRVIYNPHLHVSRSFLALVAALAEVPDHEPRAKVPLGDAPLEAPRSAPAPGSRDSLAATIERLAPGRLAGSRLVLLNANAGDIAPVRRWPLEHYRTLARGLLEIPDVLLAFTGGAHEREASRDLCASLGSDRVIDLAGRTSFDELLALYATSELLITNDSGPAHFAALVDLPVLVLFGPETPEIFRPLGRNAHVLYRHLACSPCLSVYNLKRSPCGDNRCLSSITPAEVLARAASLLGRRRT